MLNLSLINKLIWFYTKKKLYFFAFTISSMDFVVINIY